MNKNYKEKIIYKIFEWSLVVKGFNSFWEIILGYIIIFDRKVKILLLSSVMNELNERPNNFLASHLKHILEKTTPNMETYIGVYILIQGIIKIFLITGLIKRKLWVYPMAMYIFLAFVFYQSFRIIHSGSIFFLTLSILDVITILLINHEYKRLKVK